MEAWNSSKWLIGSSPEDMGSDAGAGVMLTGREAMAILTSTDVSSSAVLGAGVTVEVAGRGADVDQVLLNARDQMLVAVVEVLDP